MHRLDPSVPVRAPGESIWIYALLAFQPVFLGAVVLGYRAGFIEEQIAFWATWIALFPLVRRLNSGRRSWTRSSWPIVAGIEAATTAAVVALHLAVSLVIQVLLRAATGREIELDLVLAEQPALLVLSVVVYAFLATFVSARTSRERIAEQQRVAGSLREQLAESRFQVLRAQLNPHFVFNGLNTVSMLIRNDDKQGAIRFLAGISDLLREALDDTRPQEVRLDDELAFTEKYLAVERVRFEDRLVTVVDVASDARLAYVPTLILQPIVENAVRHGISRRPGSGRIELRAWRDEESLHLTVCDDGAGLSGDELVSGMGLRLTEARLRELYGDAAAMSVESIPEHHGVTVRMTLPFHTAPIR